MDLRGHVRAAVLLVASCFTGAIFSTVGGAGRPASASTSTDGNAGFRWSVTATPAQQVDPGGQLQYSFEFINGDITSVARLVAYDYVPFGSTLVPNSASCAGGGEACTLSTRGDLLNWVVPAGARPGASFVMSFSVAVATRYPPAAIEDQLTFTGPGCSETAGCTAQVAPVTVTPRPLDPAPVRMPPASVGGLDQAVATTTTAPIDDQNLEVQVPKCTNVKKRPKCHEPPGRSTGEGAQTGAGGRGGAQHAPRQGQGRLVATGDDEMRGIEVGSLSLLVGAGLVIAAAGGRRRPL